MSLDTSPARNGKAVATRARIINAAVKVFSRYGLRQAGMDALAAEVPMSRQSLYNHFANKEALFIAAVQALQSMNLTAAEQAADAQREAGGDALAEIVAALVARMVAWAELMQGTPHLGELLDEQNRLCADIVAQGNRDFRDSLLRRAQTQRKAGALPLPRHISTAEFIDDATTIAVGLKYGDQATDPHAMALRLHRLLRRLLAGSV
jgi:AcrR family transcriptional regulator